MESKKTSTLFVIFCAIIGNWIGYLMFFLVPSLNGLLGSLGAGLYLAVAVAGGAYLGGLKKYEPSQSVTNTRKIKKILTLVLLIIIATVTILFDFFITNPF